MPETSQPDRVGSEYVVTTVRAVTFGNVEGEEAPPAIRERFEGRLFTLHELEQRGVRIAGGRALYTAGGCDWSLHLAPAAGT